MRQCMVTSKMNLLFHHIKWIVTNKTYFLMCSQQIDVIVFYIWQRHVARVAWTNNLRLLFVYIPSIFYVFLFQQFKVAIYLLTGLQFTRQMLPWNYETNMGLHNDTSCHMVTDPLFSILFQLYWVNKLSHHHISFF